VEVKEIRKLSPILMYVSCAIYFFYAVILTILAINVYQDLGEVVGMLQPYLEYAAYLIPIAMVAGFIGWYFGGAGKSTASLFMTIGSATLLGSFLIYWAFMGATLEPLFTLWMYWIPPAVNFILGAYMLTGRSPISPPPSAIEPLFEKERRVLRTSSMPRTYYHSYMLNVENERRKRVLRTIY